jgi:hypothetical protein
MCIGAPIFLGRYPSLSAHENGPMIRTYLVCRERERETSKRHVGEAHSVLLPITSEFLPRQNRVIAHAHES